MLTAVALAALAVTGFGPLLLGSRPMRGWMMLAHCAAAPVFAVGLAMYALLHAQRLASSIAFWAMLTLAALTIATAAAGLTPWFSTDCQRTLYTVHTYAAGGLIVVAVALAVVTRRARQAGAG